MDFLNIIRLHSLTLPVLVKFALGMVFIIFVPKLCGRVRMPAAVGLLISGMLIGPYGIDLFGEHRPVADFFGEIGKLMIMFFAGLEIDLVLFRKVQHRSIIFGVVTTLFPLLLGTTVGIAFGFRLVPSIVLGSLLASHTLLGLPIARRLGANRLEAVIVTVGATILSDTLSLLVFAICVPLFKSGFSMSGLAIQLIEVMVFFPLILFGLSRVGAYALKKTAGDENTYFVVMLTILGISGFLAESINLPGIVGAFLVGVAVNSAVKENPAKDKLEFFGNSLFIPIFFMVTGFLIDPSAFVKTITENLALAMAVVAALLIGKWIAAQVAGRVFGYTSAERKTMWALTLPQVATTLAATLVAFHTFSQVGQRLVDDRLINVVLVLVLVTAVVGPLLTERFASRLMKEHMAS